MSTPNPTPSAKKRYPRRHLDQRFDCFAEGCEECEVCKYRNFTDWAESVCGSSGTIERNTRMESYLKDKDDSIQQAEQRMMQENKALTAKLEASEAQNAVSYQAGKQEMVKELAEEIDDIQYNSQAEGCGLEDRGITDRYEAMAHGWERHKDAVTELLPTL